MSLRVAVVCLGNSGKGGRVRGAGTLGLVLGSFFLRVCNVALYLTYFGLFLWHAEY
jgi:hypothetical protein